MPQLDLTFFFSAALTVNLGFLGLLYGFDGHIVPKMAEAIKLSVRNFALTVKDFVDNFVEIKQLDLSDMRDFYGNCNKKTNPTNII